MLQYIQGILYGLTSVLLCVPFILADSEKCQFCGRHVMASFLYGTRPYLSVVIFYNKYLTPVMFRQACRKPPTLVLTIIILESLIVDKLQDDDIGVKRIK